MYCTNCSTKLPEGAKFCAECGTAAPKQAAPTQRPGMMPSITVDQHVETNEGQVVGLDAGKGALQGGLNADVNQDIGLIKDGGAVVGAILGAEAPVHVGGQQNYGDVVLGGKTTVNDTSSHPVFDQRYQTVRTQYNIAGDYNPGNVQSQDAAIEELRKLLKEVGHARSAGALDADAATDAEYQLKKALNEAQKPTAEKRIILDHLATASEVIAATSAATALVTAVTQAIRMVQKLF
jgi:hypothetical protein